MVSPCGHHFCRECIFAEIAQQKKKSKKCPVCQQKLVQSKLKLRDEDESQSGAASSGVAAKKEGSRILLNSKQKMLVTLIKATLAKAPEEKSLVFSNFLESLAGVAKALEKEGIQCDNLNGGMTLDKRKKALKKFTKEKNIKVMLLTMQTGSVGINLTAANHVYLLEPSYNPAMEAQAIARAWRFGQSKKVFVTRMFVPQTIEERMLERTRKIMTGAAGGAAGGSSAAAASAAASSASSAASSAASSSASSVFSPANLTQSSMTSALSGKRKFGATNVMQIGSIARDSAGLRTEEFDLLFTEF
jgi:SWI/SNF-related matrix-associated actin-dependent regulator of chromatin subfamily A3